MVRTRVGYTGGTTENPTYYNLGDHTETIQIDYDPTQISYQELLKVFWESHDPTRVSYTRQYMSAVFYHDPEQKELVITSRDRQEKERGRKITTEILPASEFYLAEDYHQKYWLRLKPEFLREFEAVYPNTEDLIASTAAARVNGYLAGYGSYDVLLTEIDRLGLSADAQEKLLQTARRLKR